MTLSFELRLEDQVLFIGLMLSFCSGCGQLGSDVDAVQTQTQRSENPIHRYTVKQEDTLFSIAKDVYSDGTKWPSILEANSKTLRTPSDLSIGQSLIIPALPEDPESDKDSKGLQVPETYVIQPGDTLYGIAMRYYGEAIAAERILDANRDKIANKDQLAVGLEINMPSIGDFDNLPQAIPQRSSKPSE
jgi:nucleoid-associated protein YgaU